MYFTEPCQRKFYLFRKALQNWELTPYYSAVAKARGTATVGGNMRREREARHLTLETVAKRLKLERAAPLSTFERSAHVPKADTIIKYALAIGCSAADLLAGVVTDYDELRGSTEPTAVTTSTDGLRLTQTQKRILRMLAAMSDEGQRLAASRIAGLVAAFPREPLPESSAPARETPAETIRKARGK